MKKIIFGAIVALLPFTSMADTVFGFKVGAGTWDHDPSGNVTVAGSGGSGTSADLKNDLRLAEDGEGYVYFAIEHPVPLVPNIKVMQSGLTSNGSGNVTIDSSADFIIGTTGLTETTAAADSGAYLIGAYDEFANSDSANVQDVLDDLDKNQRSGNMQFGVRVSAHINIREFIQSAETLGLDRA